MTHLWLETASTGDWHAEALPLVGAADRGLVYGDGLFETIRVMQGVPLFLGRHLQRLCAGLKQLAFPAGWEASALAQRCHAVIAHNALSEGVLKIIVTRGSGPRGFAPPAEAQPTLIIQTLKVLKTFRVSKVSAIIAPWKIDPASPLCTLKHLSALDKVWAKHQAQLAGADEVVFQNIHSHLTETTSSNLFIVADEKIFTPARHCGLLPGITRAALLDSYPIIEAELTIEMLTQADEAFLTNAVGGLQSLVRVNGQPIGTGAPGPVTAALQAHYQHLIDLELKEHL